MKKLILTAALSIAATVAITACAVQQPVDINTMSLEKTSPFETPTPKAYGENAGLYRETQMGMPAMIPHAIDNFKITRENNPCIMCHGNQAKIGAAKVKGEATAMPATHWTKVDGKLAVSASRHECLLCHATQADVQCQSKAILTPNVQRWRDTSKLQSTF